MTTSSTVAAATTSPTAASATTRSSSTPATTRRSAAPASTPSAPAPATTRSTATPTATTSASTRATTSAGAATATTRSAAPRATTPSTARPATTTSRAATATTRSTAATARTTSTAGRATTSSTAAGATTTSRPTRVTTSSTPASASTTSTASTGADTIYVLEDGIRDEFYCGPTNGEPGDHIVFVGTPSTLPGRTTSTAATGSSTPSSRRIPRVPRAAALLRPHAARVGAGGRQPLGDQPVGSRCAAHDRHHDRGDGHKIAEWLDYHARLGFDDFQVVLDGDVDRTEELLRSLDVTADVTVHPRAEIGEYYDGLPPDERRRRVQEWRDRYAAELRPAGCEAPTRSPGASTSTSARSWRHTPPGSAARAGSR